MIRKQKEHSIIDRPPHIGDIAYIALEKMRDLQREQAIRNGVSEDIGYMVTQVYETKDEHPKNMVMVRVGKEELSFDAYFIKGIDSDKLNERILDALR